MSDVERNAIVVAVTGGVACGKSEVGRILESMGYHVCDADVVAHELMAKDTVVFHNIVEFFGTDILSEDGEIFRPALGKIVFEDPVKRARLDALVHPSVRITIDHWIADRRTGGENGAVQIPLLFESGMSDMDVDGIICVSASEDLVLERLRKKGIDHDAALKRIHAQMPLPEKERLADFVVRNHGSLQELEEVTRQALKRLSVER